MQMRIEPTCRFCAAKGITTPAQVADHVTPHRGNSDLFWFGELQSLSWSCHSATKQQLEVSGFSKEIGPDGWPVDCRHPVYAHDKRSTD
jgi:5-methylcytosine-specific restriction protein A